MPTKVRSGLKGYKPLLLTQSKTKMLMTEITRILAYFITFVVKDSVSFVRININEMIDKFAKRGRLLAGDAVGAT